VKNSPFKAEIFLVLNIGLAMSMLISPKLSEVYSILIVFYGIYKIMAKKNSDGSAHIFAAYSVGIEVLFRMNSGGFSYEWGKYAVVLFLVLGILVGAKKKIPFIFIALILLLLPSIMYVDFGSFDMSRQMVSFNLSGPITLGVAAIYFYRRRIPLPQFRRTLLAMLYPIAAMSIFVYFRSGALEDVEFTTESNFQASGGFGPNQVSTIFGLGIMLIALAYFLNIKLFRIKYIGVILILSFLVRGLATFSRGGMLAPAIAIATTIIIMTLMDSRFKDKLNRLVFAFFFIFVVGFFGFYYVNEVSGGLLEMRFKGESMYNKEKSNMFSGREEIFEEDLMIFRENAITGVGPGMATFKRGEISGIEVSAHIEYSRLLAEHGIFGIGVILIIVIVPVMTFFRLKSTDDRIILVMCTAFIFVTLGHAAMRIAAPGFIYGLAYIHLMRRPPG
jgi:hypothetical protein